MTLDELIAHLEKIRDEHGGKLPVFVVVDWLDYELEEQPIVQSPGDELSYTEIKRVVMG